MKGVVAGLTSTLISGIIITQVDNVSKGWCHQVGNEKSRGEEMEGEDEAKVELWMISTSRSWHEVTDL